MDLSSQSNTTSYLNNNGISSSFGLTTSNNISNHNNITTQLNNSANNIKSLLSSPINIGSFNQLRVVHHQYNNNQQHQSHQQQFVQQQSQHNFEQNNNKRSPTAMLFSSPTIASSASSALIMTPVPSMSVSSVPSSFIRNNSNNYNSSNNLILNSSSSNSSNNSYYNNGSSSSNGGDDYRNSQNSSSVAASISSSSSSSSSSSLYSGSSNSGIGNRNNDRIPCMLTDDDRLPHNSQILANRYLMLNQIAGSSFYECVDIRTGEALTCKAIGNCYSKILSAYFRMDGDPHIKPLHKLLQTSDQTYLLLPPSQYGDLHSYVRERKRLRETEARHLFRQICKTVKSCHQQGIVLRDLKLRKFVFSNYDRTYLKFESLEDAVVLENPDDDILKEKIGCPAYVAPEILKPNSDFSGKAADLWSLGVILYTMLVGRYPFNDPEHSSLFAKIARCQFTIPDYLSSKARCLIKSLLQKVPKHRLTSDDVLYHPWLQEDNNSSTFILNNNFLNNNYTINSINSINNNNDDLSNDDQRVPEIDCLELT